MTKWAKWFWKSLNLFSDNALGWTKKQKLFQQISYLRGLYIKNSATWFYHFSTFFTVHSLLKKNIFKLLGLPCCWVSKVISKDAWLYQKGIRSIWSLSTEKTSKKWSNINYLAIIRKRCVFHHILAVFLALRDRIELISFWEGQVSWDTTLG